MTTAYDILRHKGVEIGKRDYLGSLLTLRRRSISRSEVLEN